MLCIVEGSKTAIVEGQTHTSSAVRARADRGSYKGIDITGTDELLQLITLQLTHCSLPLLDCQGWLSAL